MKMTDKEKIIIDRVDVLKEKINMCFILLLNKLETPETIEQTIYEHLDAFVKEWNTQLARKTQECEKLKDKFKKFFGIDNQECWDIAFLKDENARYRKALEEIEEYVRDNSDFDKSDILTSKTGAYDILNIINKAKGEENAI